MKTELNYFNSVLLFLLKWCIPLFLKEVWYIPLLFTLFP